MKKIFLWLFIIGILSAGGVYYFFFHYMAKHDDPLADKHKVFINSVDLYHQFSQNEDSANKLFNGKTISVSGKINLIEFGNDRYTITLNSNDSMGAVTCEMDTMENKAVKMLQIGMEANLVGFCNGINIDVYLDRCKLAK